MDDAPKGQAEQASEISTEVQQLVIAAREDIEQIPRQYSTVPFPLALEMRLAVLAGDVITYVTTKIREAEGMDPSQAPGSGLIEDAQADRLGSENLAESDSA